MNAPAPRSTVIGNGRVRVKPAPNFFTEAVLNDIFAISQTPAGRALFRRVRDAGCTVTIQQPDPPTDPPNAWTLSPTARDGATEVVIACDPRDWPCPVQPEARPSDVVLFARLEDAVAMATGLAMPPQTGGISAALQSYLSERTAAPTPTPTPTPAPAPATRMPP